MLPEEPAKLLNRAEGLKEVIWTLLKAEDLNVTNWMIHDFLLDLSQGQCPQLNVQMGKGTKKLFTKYRLLCCWESPKVHWPIVAHFFFTEMLDYQYCKIYDHLIPDTIFPMYHHHFYVSPIHSYQIMPNYCFVRNVTQFFFILCHLPTI